MICPNSDCYSRDGPTKSTVVAQRLLWRKRHNTLVGVCPKCGKKYKMALGCPIPYIVTTIKENCSNA